jgi:phosphopantetheinyl transferase (holo-ACP synthase)
MIGNDVIDLRQAAVESKWQRPGFLDKLFTAAEQKRIHSEADVWMLWSCKEAAYKIVHRDIGARFYAPLAFEVIDDVILYKDASFYYTTSLAGDRIHTIAVKDPVLLKQLHVGDDVDVILPFVRKNAAGVPFLHNGPVSISHHGRYTGWVTLNK